MAETPLTGGNMGPVSRRGDDVLRTSGEWTPTVQRWLAHLRASGVSGVPEPRGITADGREVLGFLEGTVPADPMPAWVWADDILADAARLARAMHDASASFDLTGAVWRQAPREPAEVICHGDLAPYNMVFTASSESGAQRLVGLIDFDYAFPAPRAWDLAYLAYRLVPLAVPGPDWPFDKDERLRRVDLLVDAYNGEDARVTRSSVLATVPIRLRALAGFSDEMSRVLGNPELTQHAIGYRRDAGWVCQEYLLS